MINKIYKNIHSKYLNFFKFFFFLRYVFAIFLIAIALFLIIPKLFDYEKKESSIKEYLINNYFLEINDYSSITFNIFPLPNLSIKNVVLKVREEPIVVNAQKLKIFLNFNNIYNYKNFEARKIVFSEVKIDVDVEQTKELINYFGKLENKFNVETLNLDFKKNNKSLFKIKKIDFSNYGYKKYKIDGEIFGKKFKAHLSNDNKNLNFKIIKTSIKADLKFNEKGTKDLISGLSKISFLNNYLKFNFNLNNSRIKITKSNFKNKDLLISFDSLINFNPFFSAKSNIEINQINAEFINNINLDKIIANKEVLKKLNNDYSISYISKRFRNNLIKSYSSKSSLKYGRLIFLDKVVILGGEISCKGDSLLIEEYPRLNFICVFDLKNKKKLFKKLSITNSVNSDPINLNIKGSLNLLNKKINFKKIFINNNYAANEEDIKFFKETFENILFNEGFFNIFKKDKIKNFLQAVV